MNEPTTTSAGITALAVAILGPLAGEYAAIVFAALAGGFWPLSGTKDAMTTRQGAMFLLRIVLTASVLTGLLAWYIEKEFGIAARIVLAPVAFLIGMIGDGWRDIVRRLWALIEARITGKPASSSEDGK